MASLVISTKPLRRIGINSSLNLPNIEEGGTTAQIILEINITLISKPDKDITKKLHTTIPYEYRYKSPQQKTSKVNPAIYEKDYIPCLTGIYPRNARLVQPIKINVIHHINGIKDKPHMIISIDGETLCPNPVLATHRLCCLEQMP